MTPAAAVVTALRFPAYVFVRAVPCLLLVPSVRSADDDQQPSHLRVKVFHDARLSRLAVRLDRGTLHVRLSQDAAPTPLAAGTTYRIALDGQRVCLESPTERTCGTMLQAAPLTDDTEYTVTAEQGRPTASPARRIYRGALAVRADATRPGTLRAIHTVALETYVAGVVQREYGMSDLEGSKAMAVLARTYALRLRGRASDYDLVDTIDHQVYFGVEGVRDVAKQAAEQTHGEVLTYRGRLAEAVYSASSGGYTASNDQVWNSQPVSYLRAQPDPYDARMSPHTRWTSQLDGPAFLAALSRSFGPDVVGFRVTGRSDDGRAQQVRLTLGDGSSRLITATQFRRVANSLGGAMTLRSFRFDAQLDGSKAVFTGSGFGHGVGLSQWGARAQALEGRDYRQILGFYYPGTALRAPDGLAEPNPTAPTLDVFLASNETETAAPARTPEPASEPVATSARPSRNASTRVRLPAPAATPAESAPTPATTSAPPPTRRPETRRTETRPAAAPLPEGAYRRDPLGVRSAPPVARPEAERPAERAAPEPLPEEAEARAERTVVTWGSPASTPAPTTTRRTGW